MSPGEFTRIAEGVARDYPTLASKLAWDTPRFARTVELLREHMPHAKSVIDVGAWPGVFSVCMRRLGFDVIAVDRDASRQARWVPDDMQSELWRSSEADITCAELCTQEAVIHHSVDIETASLPVQAESVDAVMLLEVIEHLYHDPLFALREIHRVLRPDGVLIVSTPNLISIRNRFNVLAGHMDRVIETPFLAFYKRAAVGHFGHVRLYSPAELRVMLEMLGFAGTFSMEWHSEGATTIANSQSASVVEAPRLLKRGLFKRRNYGQAVAASIRTIIERRVPEARPHMYVIARKAGTLEPVEKRRERLATLISTNRLA